MRIFTAAAVLLSLAFSPQGRGVVSRITTGAADETGTVQMTVEGTNPCGAVHIDYGDGAAITHPISALPAALSHEYTRVGEYAITAKGMGNCDGSASSRVRVNRVRRAEGDDVREGVRGPSVTALIDSREDWTDVDLYVRRGDMLIIDVTGTIHFSEQSPATGPDGAAGRRAPSRSPMPKALIGALLGRVGRSAPFLIGSGRDPVRVPMNGPLYLRINDDVLADNRGEFRVVISVAAGRGR